MRGMAKQRHSEALRCGARQRRCEALLGTALRRKAKTMHGGAMRSKGKAQHSKALRRQIEKVNKMKILGLILIIVCGCAVSPKPKLDHRIKWHILAVQVKKHFKTDMTVEEIATDLSYRAYLAGLE